MRNDADLTLSGLAESLYVEQQQDDDGADAAALQHPSNEPRRYDTHKDKHMKLNDMIPSKYLKQSDVEQPTTVTIAALTKVNVARDDEAADYKWTVKFREFEKAMVMNPTNLKRIARYHGDDSDEWLGKKMIVYVDPDIEFGGKVTGGLRLRGIESQARPAPAKVSKADFDDDIPF